MSNRQDGTSLVETATGESAIALSIVPATLAPLTRGVDVGMLPHRTCESSTCYMHGLIYGGIGDGKTFTLTTTFNGGSVYLMDCGYESDGLDGFDHIYFEKVRSNADILSRIVYLEEMFARYGPTIFPLVIVDNITEMQRFLLQNIAGSEVPEKRHWGMVLNQMEVIIRNIQALPCHTIFVAHETEWQGVYSPYVDGSLKDKILGKFSVIGRLNYIQTELPREDQSKPIEYVDQRFIQFQQSRNVRARNRGGKLDRLEWANISDIINKYQAPRVVQATG